MDALSIDLSGAGDLTHDEASNGDTEQVVQSLFTAVDLSLLSPPMKFPLNNDTIVEEPIADEEPPRVEKTGKLIALISAFLA